MIIKSLSLANFRGFKHTEIEFQAGVNVIGGVNGSGKSSILDALRVLSGVTLYEIGTTRTRHTRLVSTDVRFGIGAADLRAMYAFGLSEVQSIVHHNFETAYNAFIKTSRGGPQRRSGTHGSNIASIPNRYEVTSRPLVVVDGDSTPFALYFSPRRSLYVERTSRGKAESGPEAAYSGALADREFRIATIADWWSSQRSLAAEVPAGPFAARENALQRALRSFIPEFDYVSPGLKTVRYPTITQPHVPGEISDEEIPLGVQTIDVGKRKGDLQLNVAQLSDGERGMLALVLEIARRLALANEHLEDPIRDGEAVVLIDEIELHLHPKWQREIIGRLERTFPNCQFIVTTHSPLILGEVRPDQVLLLDHDGTVYRPDQSLGMDSNFILEFIMGSSARDENTQRELDRIETLIETEEYSQAEDAIERMRENLGTFPDLIRLQTRIDRIRLLSV
ncbi:MAG: AAA family ATPase [Capsulimonadaceae bacterium]